MKFEAYIHKIVKNYQQIFHKDPCTNACTGVVNVRARVSSRQNVRMRVYASCAHACTRIFTKYFLIVYYYVMSLSFKFRKDLSFRCGDICKIVLISDRWRFSQKLKNASSKQGKGATKEDENRKKHLILKLSNVLREFIDM